MNLRVAVVVIVASFALAACSSTSDTYVGSNGSVALSKDDALVYAVDTDSNALFVVDTATQAPVAKVSVGKMPEKVIVGADDTVYVTNRLDRSVSVVRRGEWSEAARLPTGVEPVGLALSGDGRTLYVVNATQLSTAETGSVMAFDTRTLAQKWELPVGQEPRGIALLAGGKAMVSLQKEGDVALVDLEKQAVVKAGTDVNSQLNGPSKSFGGAQGPTPDVSFGLATVHARGTSSLASSPDGHQVYAATLLSSNATLVGDQGSGVNPQTNTAGSSGAGYGGGSCGATAVASPSVLTFGDQGDAKAHSVTDCGGTADPTVPSLVISSGDTTRPVQGPVAIVADPTGSFLYVVNQQSDNVAVVPTSQRSTAQDQSQTQFANTDPVPRGGAFIGAGTVRALIDVGAGPTGIALTKDGNGAWVYNSFDHSLSKIGHDANGVLTTVATISVTQDTLQPNEAAGRRLFYSAVDSRMNNPGTGISCATCHVESREDGHVWNFTDGPRQTPSLAGRMIDQTAPYHWSGVFPTLGDFMTHTVAQRMGGTGFTPQMADQISAFLKVIPTPDNPNRLAQPSPAQQRGQAIFAAAGCNSCHTGGPLTDNGFHDVGTFVPDLGGNVHDDVTGSLKAGLNTPSLLGLARTAPYLHTGVASTIKERILMDQQAHNDQHGVVSGLTPTEVDDLVAYLSSL